MDCPRFWEFGVSTSRLGTSWLFLSSARVLVNSCIQSETYTIVVIGKLHITVHRMGSRHTYRTDSTPPRLELRLFTSPVLPFLYSHERSYRRPLLVISFFWRLYVGPTIATS